MIKSKKKTTKKQSVKKKAVKKKSARKKPANDKLTLKQEAAAQAFIENGGNQSEAYRTAYNTEKMTTKTVWEKASRLFAIGKVAARVLDLQKASRERHEVTVDSLCIELDENRQVGKDNDQSAAMTAATLGKAKLHGLITDKKDITSGGKPIKNDWHIHPVTTKIPDEQS